MKKKILISILIIGALFTITGCGKKEGKTTSSSNLHKQEFVDMRYNEPKNYSKKEPMDTDGYKVLVYRFNDNEKKTINLYYNTNTSLYNDEDEEYEEVTINGIKWKKIHLNDLGTTYDTYMYVYNNALYTIELNEVDKFKDEFDEFMKDVSFE